jgi:hypothetical protein
MILVECRQRSTKRIDQEQVAGLAFRIQDTGAAGGLIVTTVGPQKGAELVAKASKIGFAILNAEATE